MKRFGHHAENILVEMKIPEQLLNFLSSNLPDVRQIENEETKSKAM